MTSFEKITPLPFLSDLLRTNAFTYAMRQNEANRTLHSAFKTAKELEATQNSHAAMEEEWLELEMLREELEG